MGPWDKVWITYGYQDFPPGTDERKALASIIDEAWARDLIYMTNQDTEANPKVDQWSNGTDPAAELLRMLEVRKVALSKFGEQAIKLGAPMATLEEVFLPLYLQQRPRPSGGSTTSTPCAAMAGCRSRACRRRSSRPR
jgi:hypothetical protein